MKEIYLIKSLDGKFTPAQNSDYELAKKIKFGESYRYKFSKPRNQKFHRKFWALITLVFENQEKYNNLEVLRKHLIKSAGFYDEVKNHFTGEIEKEAKSIAFANMDEIEFSELYNRILDTIVMQFGWDGEAIEENISEFM